ncbi:hypothetical protein [Burkholderia gladioli]|uniref:hypothetical protein n=1 Tax=Burkholderia gladioli TaxID=28095 RepID=UPI0012D47C86|nr:hypothetical protein [Burkholderia gladioli]
MNSGAVLRNTAWVRFCVAALPRAPASAGDAAARASSGWPEAAASSAWRGSIMPSSGQRRRASRASFSIRISW